MSVVPHPQGLPSGPPSPIPSWSLTCFWERRAHSSRVSAASSFPWRLYRAPRFLRVVFTVGLWEGSKDGFRKETREREGAELRPTQGQREEGKRPQRPGSGLGWRVSEAKTASPWQLTCSLCRPCTSLRTQYRVCRPLGAGSAEQRGGEARDESTGMLACTQLGAGWAAQMEGTLHLWLVLRWEVSQALG